MVTVRYRNQQQQDEARRQRLIAARKAASQLSVAHARQYSDQKNAQTNLVREDLRLAWEAEQTTRLAAVDTMLQQAQQKQGEGLQQATSYATALRGAAREEAGAWQAEYALEDARYRLARAQQYVEEKEYHSARDDFVARRTSAADRDRQRSAALRQQAASSSSSSQRRVQEVFASLAHDGGRCVVQTPSTAICGNEADPLPRHGTKNGEEATGTHSSLRYEEGDVMSSALPLSTRSVNVPLPRRGKPPVPLVVLAASSASYAQCEDSMAVEGDAAHAGEGERSGAPRREVTSAARQAALRFVQEQDAAKEARREEMEREQQIVAERAADVLHRQRMERQQQRERREDEQTRRAAVMEAYRRPPSPPPLPDPLLDEGPHRDDTAVSSPSALSHAKAQGRAGEWGDLLDEEQLDQNPLPSSSAAATQHYALRQRARSAAAQAEEDFEAAFVHGRPQLVPRALPLLTASAQTLSTLVGPRTGERVAASPKPVPFEAPDATFDALLQPARVEDLMPIGASNTVYEGEYKGTGANNDVLESVPSPRLTAKAFRTIAFPPSPPPPQQEQTTAEATSPEPLQRTNDGEGRSGNPTHGAFGFSLRETVGEAVKNRPKEEVTPAPLTSPPPDAAVTVQMPQGVATGGEGEAVEEHVIPSNGTQRGLDDEVHALQTVSTPQRCHQKDLLPIAVSATEAETVATESQRHVSVGTVTVQHSTEAAQPPPPPPPTAAEDVPVTLVEVSRVTADTNVSLSSSSSSTSSSASSSSSDDDTHSTTTSSSSDCDCGRRQGRHGTLLPHSHRHHRCHHRRERSHHDAHGHTPQTTDPVRERYHRVAALVSATTATAAAAAEGIADDESEMNTTTFSTSSSASFTRPTMTAEQLKLALIRLRNRMRSATQ